MDAQAKITKISILFILLCFAKSGIAKKKVVIVGAGVSGLSAARVISRSGLAKVRIVEASNRYGGRISTDRHKGHMFERGAQWIHGAEGNPVFEFLAENTRLKIENWGRYAPPEGTKFQYYSGREVTPDIKDLFWNSSKLLEYMDYAIQRLIEVENKTEVEVANISLGKIARSIWKKKFGSYSNHGIAKIATDPVLADQFVLLNLIVGANPDIVNILSWYQYTEFGYNDVQLVHGYRSLTTKLRRSIPRNALKFNRKVKSIEWFKENRKRIVVRYEKGGRKRKISADYVLVTVSLGVLKKYHNTLFVPNLPIEKQTAIKNMGFGTVNKMILFYENPFWGPEFADVHMLWDSYDKTQNNTFEDEFSRKNHWCRNLDIISSYGNNFLLLWLTENASKSVRNVSISDIKSTVTNLLRKFLNKPDLTAPDDIILTEWDIDDNFLGSYSYLAIGQTKDYQRTLAEPLYVNGNPRVMFAGEALSISRFSTVDGAFSTGKSEGERIVKLLKDQQKKST